MCIFSIFSLATHIAVIIKFKCYNIRGVFLFKTFKICIFDGFAFLPLQHEIIPIKAFYNNVFVSFVKLTIKREWQNIGRDTPYLVYLVQNATVTFRR